MQRLLLISNRLPITVEKKKVHFPIQKVLVAWQQVSILSTAHIIVAGLDGPEPIVSVSMKMILSR